jgi:hypothetical protein
VATAQLPEWAPPPVACGLRAFRVATHWYFGGSAEQLKELYTKLYTDSFR